MKGPVTLEKRLFPLAIAATLVLLLLHAAHFWFLTDDSFISFRYARNLAQGHGLVFNPGGERVEGYTNFLWVILLAGFDRLGAAPESVAPVLGLVLTAALWGLVAWYAIRLSPPGPHHWLALVPLVFLAATRSVAVWATSGLETRFFETLVVAGALTLIAGLEREGSTPLTTTRSLDIAGLLFGLAALTRPDGVLLGFAALGAAFLTRPSRRLLRPVIIFLILTGGHLIFRGLYYGELLPNTYHAKVGGRAWWRMGGRYVALFVLEYAVFLWIPLLVLACKRIHGKRGVGTMHRLAIIAAIILPHALYITAIGGDHFEFRPFDLYFPLLFIIMYDGAKAIAASRGLKVAAACCVLVLAGLASPLRLPGYASLLAETNAAFVGLRAEEHATFLASVVPEGKALGKLVASGVLSEDTHVAIDCVGAIPYYSGLTVLDRLGLTDREVAREGIATDRLMAHDRRASPELARRRGVDLWAADFVHLLWNPADPGFTRLVAQANQERASVWAASTEDGRFLLVSPLQGIGVTRHRFPRLEFLPVSDASVARRLLQEAASVAAPH